MSIVADFKSKVLEKLGMNDRLDLRLHYQFPNYVLFSYCKLIESTMNSLIEDIREVELPEAYTADDITWWVHESMIIIISYRIKITSRRTKEEIDEFKNSIISVIREVAGSNAEIKDHFLSDGSGFVYKFTIDLPGTDKLKDKFEKELKEVIEHTPFYFPDHDIEIDVTNKVFYDLK